MRVDTDEPVEAPPRALLISAFCCWLRTASDASLSAVVVVARTDGAASVLATAPVAAVPLIEPPDVLM